MATDSPSRDDTVQYILRFRSSMEAAKGESACAPADEEVPWQPTEKSAETRARPTAQGPSDDERPTSDTEGAPVPEGLPPRMA